MDFSLAESIKEELWALYCEKGRKAVSDRLGIRYNSVGHVLKYMGFYDRKEEHKSQVAERYKLPNNPFLVDSPLKYYLTGYVLGDGSIYLHSERGYRYIVNFSSSDYNHILKLRSFFSDSIPLREDRGNYLFDIRDNSIARWLLSYGLCENKSKCGCYLPDIPDEYKIPFLCGLMDSDGGIYYQNNKTGLHVKWYGHETYMNQVFEMVKSLGFNPWLNVRKTDNLYCVCVSRQEQVKRLLERIYKETPVYLKRKYERYKEFYKGI
jgi:hypothetical protein